MTVAELDNFKFYSQHAAAAYCHSHVASGELVKRSGQCNDVKAEVHLAIGLSKDGFAAAQGQIADNVEEAINEVAKLHPVYKIIVTGHSLGGAVAVLGGSYFRQM
ncbi:hypothetical protein PT974_03660 [Cladobotryum mycophilum]|uniref:Fungal lipase-type domain-containing protein n=1 Tax=Cladobotryum mycophilum TaxID=491253 RepID=A0ABR0SSX7_9HYPO